MNIKYIEQMSRSGISNKEFKSEFGSKILSKFGWKKGEGLGKDKKGVIEPVQVKRREENIGLGKIKTNINYNNEEWKDNYNQVLKEIVVKEKNKSENEDRLAPQKVYNLRKSSLSEIKVEKEPKNSRKNSVNRKNTKSRKESMTKPKITSRKNSSVKKEKTLLKKKRNITFIEI